VAGDEEPLAEEFNFQLTKSISYSKDGQSREADFVTLRAPTSRNVKECALLKQAFFRSLPKSEGQESGKPEDSVIEGHDVMDIIAAGNCDLGEVLETARHLFTKGKVAMVDGETPLTQPLADALSVEDFEGMVGEYLVHFTLASSLRRMGFRRS
jgi:hypothetical protein